MSWRPIGNGTVLVAFPQPSQSIAPADQETCDFFLRRAAPEQNHMVLRLAQLAQITDLVDAAQEMRFILDKLREESSGKAAYGNWSDRIGGEAVACRSCHSQEIAGHRKSDDLSAASGNNL